MKSGERMGWGAWTFILVATAHAFAGEIDSVSLLSRARDKVISDAKAIPRYMCRQTIERRTFAIPAKANCPAAILVLEHAKSSAGLRVVSYDRVKLDVMLTRGSEMFAWPGHAKFSAENPGDLLAGGLSGTGDFASFVIHIFTVVEVTFRYEGLCGQDSCARFSYRMPVQASGYILRTRLSEVTVGYRGTFDVDPRSAELLRLLVIPIEPERAVADLCSLQTEMTYTRSGAFMIPKSAAVSTPLNRR